MSAIEPPSAAAADLTLAERHRDIRWVTLVGSALDLALGVAKIIGGWIGQSQGLIADGVHSLSDLATDIVVLYAAKHAHAEADDEHPYGHARIETAATVGLGGVLVLTGLGIAWDAGQRAIAPESPPTPAAWGLVIALISVVSKEAMYHYTKRYAERLNSSLLHANAWHTRTDAASSIVVIIGLAGALMGFAYLDALAALVVGLFIAKIGYGFAQQSLRELIDTGLRPSRLKAIRGAIMAIDGVRDLHMLRTRQMGGKALVDVHIILSDPRVSVSEGHYISETVRQRLIEQVPEVEDVMVHIDPEDDENGFSMVELSRHEILERLDKAWAGVDAARHIRRVTLHYLGGKVQVDVEMPLNIATKPDERERLLEQLRVGVRADPVFASVRVTYVDGAR